jgi:hypothetical protein
MDGNYEVRRDGWLEKLDGIRGERRREMGWMDGWLFK